MGIVANVVTAVFLAVIQRHIGTMENIFSRAANILGKGVYADAKPDRDGLIPDWKNMLLNLL